MSRKLRITACAGLLALTTTAHASLPPNMSRYTNLAKVTPFGYSLRPPPANAGRVMQVRINGQTIRLSPQASQALMQALAPLIQRTVTPLLGVVLPIMFGQAPLPLDMLGPIPVK
ncbi:MAG: hypothetical protein EON60_13285 [Alphaproteobacteria bacterium]|nr:MAG: hypothetical protein EON60_13285 [Alphaproteobacteria bacterium]